MFLVVSALQNVREVNSLLTLYENEHILVVLKPSTIPTHPSSLYHKNSIIYMVKHGLVTKYNHQKNDSSQCQVLEKNNFCLISSKYQDLKDENQDSDYWITHRLDRLTSGLLIIAKDRFMANHFIKMFKERRIKKKYLCLVHGKFDHIKYQKVCAKIGKSKRSKHHNRMALDFENGKYAETEFEIIWYDEDENISLLLCKPLTGRQHQIRVHLALFCKNPIVNDSVYGSEKNDGKYETFCLDETILFKVNNRRLDKNEFGCHICDDANDSIGIWWSDLVKSTTVLNNGIYLHAFCYEAVDGSFCFQTPLPVWSCPPSNKTQILKSVSGHL